jgi:hypothetical protein
LPSKSSFSSFLTDVTHLRITRKQGCGLLQAVLRKVSFLILSPLKMPATWGMCSGNGHMDLNEIYGPAAVGLHQWRLDGRTIGMVMGSRCGSMAIIPRAL